MHTVGGCVEDQGLQIIKGRPYTASIMPYRFRLGVKIRLKIKPYRLLRLGVIRFRFFAHHTKLRLLLLLTFSGGSLEQPRVAEEEQAGKYALLYIILYAGPLLHGQ